MTAAVRPARRDDVLALLATERRALHVDEIATRLEVPAGSYDGLQRLLDDLSYDGSVVALPGQRFKLTEQQAQRVGARATTYEGFLNVNPRGFGFVSVVGMTDDVFVPAESMKGALHGDKVELRIASRSRRGLEGEVIRIVEHRTARVAGTLRRRGRSAWLEPDDARVRGPIVLKGLDATTAGEDGAAAVVTITRFPELPDENPEGVLEAVLGDPGDPKVEVAKILLREGIEEAHPAAAVAEAEAYGDRVDDAALAGRVDLTGIPLPTIDPEDARDHDDAVWAVRNDDGSYKAWIAIADVSHYVRPGTALDASALARGTSIYLPDRAIPMLPRALSSNLCSLLPGVIRLCLCVEVDLDAAGTVTQSRIVEGFMRSAAKLTYPGVARALGFTPAPERSPEAEAMRADLQVLWDLSRLLRAKRMRRGALDLDLPEAKVVLDPDTGAPIDVQKRSQDPGVAKAYQLIEELMLLGNETVAGYLVQNDIPGIFRDHAPPDEAKLDRFAALAAELGLKFEIEDALDPKRLSALLKKIAAHPLKQVLQMLLLRAMKQAVYDVVNVGHFGLASAAYLHFTSPIRRYPDLVVHRAVRAALRGEHVDRSGPAREALRNAATVASDRERKAMEIEREIVDLHRALLMRDAVGRILEGTVTSLVGTGVFVNVAEPFLDVLVRLESLGPDRYELDDERLRVIGARSGDRIALGDSMVVEISDVSVLRRTVYGRRIVDADGSLSEGGSEGGGRGDRPPKRRATKRSGSTVKDSGPPARASRTTQSEKKGKRKAEARPTERRKPTKGKKGPKAGAKARTKVSKKKGKR
jgi:ribonuclease R